MMDVLKENMTGVVKFFEGDFGFIQSDDPEYDDIYVHYTNIEPWRRGYKNLKIGQSVKFVLVVSDRGVQAKELEIHPDDRIRDVSKFEDSKNRRIMDKENWGNKEWRNQNQKIPGLATAEKTERLPHSKFQIRTSI